jgi:hypothetical protein
MTSALLPANLVFRAFTQTGVFGPLVGGKLYFYQPGTSTPQAAYTDATGLVALANPVILDANGQAQFWLKSGLTYKINLTDAAGVQQAGWPADQVIADQAATILPNFASVAPGYGDALIGVQSTLAGSQPRTQHDKNAETVSVFDFFTDAQKADVKAKTCLLDVSSAIQAASDAMVATGGGVLEFPPGKYAIGTGLKFASNVRYQGLGMGSMYPSAPTTYQGVTFVWIGGLSGTMVTLRNTWHTHVDGISLLGTWTSVNSSTLIGIDVYTDETMRPIPDGAANSQRNYISNFSIQKCRTAVAFGFALGVKHDGGNMDGWIVERFIIDECQDGFYFNSSNILYNKVQNGIISVHGTGAWLAYAGSVAFDALSYYGMDLTGTTGMFSINDNSGIVSISNCQAEQPKTGTPSYSFIDFNGGTKLTPTTVMANAIHIKVEVGAPQAALTFIGNDMPSPVYLRAGATGSNIVSINDHQYSGNGFQVIGTGINLDVSQGDGQGTWTPQIWQGTTQITTPGTAIGTWVRKGKQIFIKWYFYKASGAPSATGAFTLQGLPFTSEPSASPAILNAGEVTINNTRYDLTTPYKWRVAPNSVTAALAGTQSSASWTTGSILFEGSGTYEIP